MPPRTCAVIDVGSNTTKVKIASCSSDGKFEQLLYKNYDTPLIGTGGNNTIGEEAARDCIAAIKEIQALAASHGVVSIKAIGTEALRIATNREQFLKQIKSETGVDIEVISEEQEAQLTLKAVQMDFPDSYFACINGGGGSTELGWHQPSGNRFHVFNFGAKTLTDRYFKNASDPLSAADEVRKMISDEIKKIDATGLPSIGRIVSVGGSIWAAAALIKRIPQAEFERLNGATITIDDLERLAKQLFNNPATVAQSPYAPSAKRLEVLPAGMLVHLGITGALSKNEITISTRSIADAVLLECCSL